MITLVNGRRTNKISIHDRGLAYGDGVFETMLSVNGHVPLWDNHISRLKLSLKKLNISPYDTRDLLDTIKSHLDMSCQQIIKLTVTRGIGPRGYSLPVPSEPTTIISIVKRSPDIKQLGQNGIRIKLCETYYAKQSRLAGLKHLNRLEQVLARMEVDDSGHDEGIMLDETGKVISATAHNLFLVKDGAMSTPDLTLSGVSGVMRQFVIGLADEEKIPVTIKEVAVEELLASDELFLTNSINGIWPICELDSTIMNVGDITSRLRTRVMDVIPYCD